MQPGSTPLIAIDALVLDTETTGLDVAVARVLQVGAVRLRAGRLDPAAVIDQLVDPGVPIPPATTRIHHIDDARVAGAPRYADLAARIDALLGDGLVIGHSIGFDLAILKREAERLRRPFRAPRTLDTALLARIAEPSLPDASLDVVAGWLGIAIEGRHSALGDARATAAVFLALIPRLRPQGLRTLAQAEAACRRLTDAIEARHRAGWLVDDGPAAMLEPALARVDSYPYRHRVREVMTRDPILADPREPLSVAIARLSATSQEAVFVRDPADQDADAPPAGIVTSRDLLRALTEDGADALARPLGAVMSSPVATVPADAFVYRAMGRMDRLGIRHLGAVDETGRLVGALAVRDLLHLRAGLATALGDAIDVADDPAALALAFAGLPGVAEGLAAEQVPIGDIAAVIAREVGALTRRTAVLAEAAMREAGLGPPPVPYALVVLGSAGRDESLLAADQDNAVIFAEGEPGGPEDRWFAAFGERLADGLDAAGLPLCRGGVMARNPAWRGSLRTWRHRIDGWIARSTTEDVMAVDVFFDLRPVQGDTRLARHLLAHGHAAARGSLAFLKHLAADINDWHPPLTLFGSLKLDRGRVDLKTGGLQPIVAAARVLALRHGLPAASTRERLAALRAAAVGPDGELGHLLDAVDLLQRLILAAQVADLAGGHPIGTAVDPDRIAPADRQALKGALARLGHLPQLTRDLLY